MLICKKSNVQTNMCLTLALRAKLTQKFIAPNSEEIPDKCNPKIAKSTLAPL